MHKLMNAILWLLREHMKFLRFQNLDHMMWVFSIKEIYLHEFMMESISYQCFINFDDLKLVLNLKR